MSTSVQIEHGSRYISISRQEPELIPSKNMKRDGALEGAAYRVGQSLSHPEFSGSGNLEELNFVKKNTAIPPLRLANA